MFLKTIVMFLSLTLGRYYAHQALDVHWKKVTEKHISLKLNTVKIVMEGFTADVFLKLLQIWALKTFHETRNFNQPISCQWFLSTLLGIGSYIRIFEFANILEFYIGILRVFMWQLYSQLFASSYIWLACIFEASYSTVVTSVSKKSGVDQSELEK